MLSVNPDITFLPTSLSIKVEPNCCFPLSNPVVYLSDTDVDLLRAYISEAPTFPVNSPTDFIFSVVANVESTNLDCASAAFLAILSAMNSEPAKATTAVPAATYGLVSIGAMPATAEAAKRPPVTLESAPVIIAPMATPPSAAPAPPE